MLKQFIKDSGIYGISGVITRGISLILVPFYTRVLTPGDYGVIDLVSIIGAIVSFTFPLEITQAIARFYPDCLNKEESKQYASTALFFTIATFGLFLFLIQTFSLPLSHTLFDSEKLINVLRVSGLAILSNGLFYFVQNQLRWRLEPKRNAICSVVYSIFTIGLSIYLVLILRIGVIGVFWAQFIGGAIAFVFGFYLSLSSYALIFRVPKLKEMLIFSIPLVPSSIGVFILTYIDRISIRSLMGLSDLGLYGIGFRIASIVGIVMMSITSAITPLIYAKYRERDTPDQIARIFRYFIFGALFLTAILSIFAKEALWIMTTPPYFAAAAVVPFLVVSGFLSQMYVFAPGLSIAKKTKYIAAINIIGAGFNLGLNLLLIPRFGIVGAALATAFASAFIFSLNVYFSQRNYFVPHDAKTLFSSVLISIVVITGGYFLKAPSFAATIIIKSIVLVIFMTALIANKLVSFKEIKYYSNKIRLRLN